MLFYFWCSFVSERVCSPVCSPSKNTAGGVAADVRVDELGLLAFGLVVEFQHGLSSDAGRSRDCL